MFKAELRAAEVDPRFTKKETQSAVSKKHFCNFRPIALKRIEPGLQSGEFYSFLLSCFYFILLTHLQWLLRPLL